MPKKYVLVTGNGFDLDLGLETRYSDFAKSQEWATMCEKYTSRYGNYYLLKYLNERKTDYWFDIEQALLDYASVENENTFERDVGVDKIEYQAVCDSLKEYLEHHVRTRRHSIDKLFGIRLLQEFQKGRKGRKIYTFNYTPLKLIARVAAISSLIPFVHMHGSIEDGGIILGFNIKSPQQIIPEYSFMVKNNSPLYHPTKLKQDLVGADEVIIFGHSMNMIDANYFKNYLQFLSEDFETDKRLTMITYNSESSQMILKNIQQMGIDTHKLFTRGNVEFVLSEDIENRSPMQEKLKRLLERMKY